ncbi:hypothetical protein BC939DRAFT_399992 [Gamsiella multidivaricata]|uniref:uncharacterized protein n=1 Tax=Gamsiella multidivaricata TaxID=101098 RepID=UPI00221FA952|nr:uncharacterized protein BC939DRAFT_399992 [Gamsiella multidivaricata]KAI7819819.1 hypothetical protein BC939DRAFT_399992 [Gamsiella multidivaricata]
MQNLRRSLQNKSSSGGLSSNRAPAALAPPRKVIKALYDYNSQQSEELSFIKGDFFHVVGNEDDEDWYEACNPVTGARGYVPVTYFQILEKNQRNSNQSLEDSGNDSGSFTEPSPAHGQGQQNYYQQQHQQQQPQATVAPPAPQKPKCQPLYGIVLYDFGAERPDELDAKVGDAILVIAQSNEEWYVAKPIGRLGGPGLIPVSFVEIRDMATGKPIDVQEMLRQTGTVIPRVEEWKKQTMEYKANSIPLEPAVRRNPSQDFDSGRRMSSNGRHTGAAAPASRNNGDIYDDGTHYDSDAPLLVNASVDSYHHEDDQYWFTVRVEYASGVSRNLYRLYEDFYSFHIALLEEFPVESGRVGGQPRILPFMPIPLEAVDDTVTASRRADLDGYVKDLCALPARITQHPLVEQLLALRDGDTEIPIGGVGNGPASPSSVGRSTPTGSMFHSASSAHSGDRRPSPSGPRAVFVAKAQSGGYRSYSDDPPSANASPSLRSQSSFATPSALNPSEEMIKVKISYQEDIMAMRIPVAITFRSLQQKIFERLNTEHGEMSYRDDRGDFARIQGDEDVREAIDNSGGKLMVYVD